jgi:stage II sporulation protein D
MEAGSDGRTVRIWLKIFQKRDRITLNNRSGLLVNDASIPVVTVDIALAGGRLETGGALFDSVRIYPADGGLTTITTVYGEKTYSGFFDIGLKEGQLFVVNTTPFNDYLMGVVGSEMGESFRLEALKAQAVCSRTYFLAVREKSGDYDACDVAGRFQAFRGMQYAGDKTREAVLSTDGQVLRSPDPDFIPWFHSTCGGMLLTPAEAWRDAAIDPSRAAPRFDSDENSPRCRISPFFSWSACLEEGEIIRALKKQTGHDISGMEFVFNNHGLLRHVLLSAGNKKIEVMPGFTFKACLERQGIAAIRSVRFSAEKKGDRWCFTGRGFGHLVGLCQWGAEAQARQGKVYDEILKSYYPGVSVLHKDGY